MTSNFVTLILQTLFEKKAISQCAKCGVCLQQIKDKGYATAYAADPRRLFTVGASFSSKTGTVEEWKTA